MKTFWIIFIFPIVTFGQLYFGQNLWIGERFPPQNQPQINFNGANLVAPVGAIQTGNGIMVDPGNDASQYWGWFGTNSAIRSIDATFVTGPSYGSSGQEHCGVIFSGNGASSSANFSCFAGINTGTGKFDVIDRTNASPFNETYDSSFSQNYGFTSNETVRILIVSNTENSVKISAWTNGVEILSNALHTFIEPFAVTNGWQGIHAYGMVCTNIFLAVTNGLGQEICAPPLWMNEYNDGGQGGDFILSNNSIDIFSDGTHGSVNNYKHLDSPLKIGDGTINCDIDLVSGRGIGLWARSTGRGDNGYFMWYDSANTELRCFKFINGSPTVLGYTFPVTLLNGSDYPVTLILSGSSIRFTVNGVTGSWSDSTFSSGFYGVGSFQSESIFSFP